MEISRRSFAAIPGWRASPYSAKIAVDRWLCRTRPNENCYPNVATDEKQHSPYLHVR